MAAIADFIIAILVMIPERMGVAGFVYPMGLWILYRCVGSSQSPDVHLVQNPNDTLNDCKMLPLAFTSDDPGTLYPQIRTCFSE